MEPETNTPETETRVRSSDWLADGERKLMGTENYAQLQQLLTTTWDGNLISKHARDELVKAGLVERAHGWNWITRKGIDVVHSLGGLKA